MALRIKRAVAGRFVKGRFVPNPSGMLRYKAHQTSLLKEMLNLPPQQVSTKEKKGIIKELHRRGVDVSHLARFYKVKTNPKSKTEEALYKVIRKSGYSRRESKRLAKLNLPYFQTKPSSSNPMKVAVTMIETFHPPRDGVMKSGQRYYVRPKDAEELKKRGLARITHEGKRKSNPVKTKVVKRGAHWFAEMSSGAGTSTARYDTKAEAKKAAADYRRIHKTGRLSNPAKPPVIHVWRLTNGKWTFTIESHGSYNYASKEFDKPTEAKEYALEHIGKPGYHVGTQEEWRHAKAKVYRGISPSFTGIMGYY